MIYIIQAQITKAIRIGHCTMSIEKKMKELQKECPESLILLHELEGTQDTKVILHYRFASSHMHDEWFKYSDELAKFISDPKMPEVPGVALRLSSDRFKGNRVRVPNNIKVVLPEKDIKSDQAMDKLLGKIYSNER